MAKISLDTFVQTTTGEALLYPPNKEELRGECYQLFNFYNRDVVCAPDFLKPRAYQLYTEFPGSPLEKFYDRIEMSSGAVAQYGDAVIFSDQLPNSGNAGHVSICTDPHATLLNFLGFDTNWGGRTAHPVIHNYDYVIGFLRPKKGKTMTKEDAAKLALYMRLASGDELSKATLNNDEDTKQILANPGYAAALVKKLYEGNELFRYKAAHYDTDVAKAGGEAASKLQAIKDALK